MKFPWEHKYLLLLLALILLLLLHPLLSATSPQRLVYDVLLSLVFLSALGVLFSRRGRRLVAFLVGVPTLFGLWCGYVLPGLPRQPVAIGFHASAALFLAIVVAAIAREIGGEEKVSRDAVLGAFCGYLLLGVMFGHVYCILEYSTPGSFEGRGLVPHLLPPGGRLHYMLTYFSLITLTTLGYGDIVPATDAARGLSAVEAITGQFYIAVLIAELIGRRFAGRA
jgi:voltage-gated potassium channel